MAIILLTRNYAFGSNASTNSPGITMEERVTRTETERDERVTFLYGTGTAIIDKSYPETSIGSSSSDGI